MERYDDEFRQLVFQQMLLNNEFLEGVDSTGQEFDKDEFYMNLLESTSRRLVDENVPILEQSNQLGEEFKDFLTKIGEVKNNFAAKFGNNFAADQRAVYYVEAVNKCMMQRMNVLMRDIERYKTESERARRNHGEPAADAAPTNPQCPHCDH